MQAGGQYSDFKLVKGAKRLMLEVEIAWPHPLIRTIEGWGSKYCIFVVLHLKSEKFWENLKIHAGSDDKLRIQFASPNRD